MAQIIPRLNEILTGGKVKQGAKNKNNAVETGEQTTPEEAIAQEFAEDVKAPIRAEPAFSSAYSTSSRRVTP